MISQHSEVIVIARGDVAKMCRGQRFPGERLKLHDVQDLRGGGYWRKRLQKRARRWNTLCGCRTTHPCGQADQAADYCAPRHTNELTHGIPRRFIVIAA